MTSDFRHLVQCSRGQLVQYNNTFKCHGGGNDSQRQCCKVDLADTRDYIHKRPSQQRTEGSNCSMKSLTWDDW